MAKDFWDFFFNVDVYPILIVPKWCTKKLKRNTWCWYAIVFGTLKTDHYIFYSEKGVSLRVSGRLRA